MFPASDPHPLDTDLLDMVDGSLDERTTRAVEEHLAACVLCRIKRQRLTDAPPANLTDLLHVRLPDFAVIETIDSPPTDPAPGELWLTEGDSGAMVLVRKVLDGDLGLVVVPVIFDVEAADKGTLVLDAGSSPLGVPIAIYDRMLSSLPTRTLRSRVVPIRQVDLLNVVEGEPGVTRGSQLTGPGDVRHEVRQYVADRLTMLSPLDDDDDQEEQPPAAQETDYVTVRRELDELSADGLTVDACPALVNCPSDWMGLGRIVRRYQVIAVIGTPAGLISEFDFIAAARFAARESMSAVAICPRDGETVDLYPPEGLYKGYVLPGGELAREPFITGFGLYDSVQKFLGTRERWNVPTGSEAGPVETVNVPELLRSLVVEETEKLATENVRTEKREGWRRVADRGSRLAEVMRDQLDGTFEPSRLADVAEEDLT